MHVSVQSSLSDSKYMPCIALGSSKNLRSVLFADLVGNFHVHKNAMLFTVLEEPKKIRI